METGAREYEVERNREREEELARLGRALPTDMLAQLSRLTRSVPPETFSSWMRVLQSMPPDASMRMALETLDPSRASGIGSGLGLSVLRRSARALYEAVEGLSPEELSRLVSEETDAEVLFELASVPWLMEAVEHSDPLAEARLRGVQEQRRLLEEAGGAVGVTEAAEILSISRQAVDARRKKGRILAVSTGRHGWRYPLCQFDGGSESGLLPGLEQVLDAIDDEGGWMVLAFLLSPEERLGARRPLDVLKDGEVEEIEAAVEAAKAYGEHVAS